MVVKYVIKNTVIVFALVPFFFFFTLCECVFVLYNTFVCTKVTNLEVQAASKICLAAVTVASDFVDCALKIFKDDSCSEAGGLM